MSAKIVFSKLASFSLSINPIIQYQFQRNLSLSHFTSPFLLKSVLDKLYFFLVMHSRWPLFRKVRMRCECLCVEYSCGRVNEDRWSSCGAIVSGWSFLPRQTRWAHSCQSRNRTGRSRFQRIAMANKDCAKISKPLHWESLRRQMHRANIFPQKHQLRNLSRKRLCLLSTRPDFWNFSAHEDL